jgi:hypothetical protein
VRVAASLVLLGLILVVVGVYVLFGSGWAILFGGAVLVTLGLLMVDVDKKDKKGGQ